MPSMSRPAAWLGSTGKPSAARRSRAAVLARSGRPAFLEQDVAPGREVAAGRDPRVQLAQRAGTAVARVGVERQTLLLALGVDARELRLGHVDLATHLEVDRLGEHLGDGADRAQVGRDVLARATVAAGGAQDEAPLLVAQADGQSVDLELGHVGRSRLTLRQAEPAPHPCVEGTQLVGIEGVGQRQHGHAVLDLAQGTARSARRPHALRRRIGRQQLRDGRSPGPTSSRRSRSYSASASSGASSS